MGRKLIICAFLFTPVPALTVYYFLGPPLRWADGWEMLPYFFPSFLASLLGFVILWIWLFLAGLVSFLKIDKDGMVGRLVEVTFLVGVFFAIQFIGMCWGAIFGYVPHPSSAR
jgi:hypothetical protein